MARPKKAITFFKRDIDLTSDSRVRKVLRQHGGLAIVVYEEILCMIYETGGYTLKWNDDYILDIADRLYEKEPKTISDIFNSILESGLFSKEYFNREGILTSVGIQERFKERVKNSSKQDVVITDYPLPIIKNPEKSQDKNSFNGITPNNSELNGIIPGYSENYPDRVRERVRVRDNNNPPTNNSLSYNTGTGGEVSDCEKNTNPDDSNSEIEQEEEPETVKPDSDPLSPSLTSGSTCPSVIYQDTPTNDSRGGFGDYRECADSDPVSRVVVMWNQIFQGTEAEYRQPYVPEILKTKITRRLKINPEIETFRKVFTYARKEWEGKGLNNHQFGWDIFRVFKNDETFDFLLSKAGASAVTPSLSSKRGTPTATREDYLRYAFN